jgi:hypothetical protein
MNIVPKMKRETLIDGYQQILQTIYAPKEYYARIQVFLKEFHPHYEIRVTMLKWSHIAGFFNSMWLLGVVDKSRAQFWKFILGVLVKKPKVFPISLFLAAYGYHFRKVADKIGKGYCAVPVKVENT